MTIASDIISDIQLVDLTHRDAQFVRAELIEAIDKAIAAAVAAERKACEMLAVEHGAPILADAIRARKDVTK